MDAYHTETIEFNGRDFRVSLHYDSDRGAPWDENDCHGSVHVRRGDRSEKRPGEIIICTDYPFYWVYDFQSAVKKAREVWGIKSGPDAVKAVTADMRHLKGYLDNEWHYCGVSVQILDSEGEPIGEEFDHAVWGVESNGECWREIAGEIAGEILYERAAAWKKHQKERRAVKYWASRDVMTEGARV